MTETGLLNRRIAGYVQLDVAWLRWCIVSRQLDLAVSAATAMRSMLNADLTSRRVMRSVV